MIERRNHHPRTNRLPMMMLALQDQEFNDEDEELADIRSQVTMDTMEMFDSVDSFSVSVALPLKTEKLFMKNLPTTINHSAVAAGART